MSSEDSFLFEDFSESLQLTVLNNAGKAFTIKVGLNETMRNLKAKIYDKCEIPLEKQCFTCFDERTLWNGNDGMTETMNDIQAIRADLKAVNTAMNDVSLQPNNIDEYDQEHDFDSNSSFEEIQSSSDEMRTQNKENQNSCDQELSEEFEEESDLNQSDEEETEVNEIAGPSQLPSNSTPHQTNIIYAPNYRIENGFYHGKLTKRLYIFDTEDESLCYTYTSNKGSEKSFICNPCSSVNRKENRKRKQVSASLISNENGEECIKLNGKKHVCERQKLEIQTKIDKSKFKLVEEKCGDRDIKHLYVFTSDDKSSYYNYTCQNNQYLCFTCQVNYHLQVTAHVVEDENGEEICFLSAQKHQCEPRKYVPAKSTSGKRQRKTKK